MTISDEQCARTPDASLYVLGELHGRQEESFARHLRRCEECADEVDLLQQVADAVPLLSAPRQAPAVEEEPRIAHRVPTLTVAASNARASRASNPSPTAPDRPRELQIRAARPVLRQIDGGRGALPPRSGSGRRLLKNPIPKPALIGLVALAILAITTVALSSQAANVRYYRIQAGWSEGGAALQLQGNKLRLLVEGMPKPAAGTGYQVWVVDRSDEQLAPTHVWLHLNSAGEAGLTVPGDYHDWLAVTVYTEPLHGRDTTRSGPGVVGDLRRLP